MIFNDSELLQLAEGIMRQFDIPTKGYLSTENVMNMYQSLHKEMEGNNFTSADLEGFTEVLDSNRDGKIDFNDIYQNCKKWFGP